MYCRNCGAEVPETARFCSHCGVSMDGNESLLQPDAGTVQQTRPKRKTGIALIIVAAVVVAAVVVVLILMMSGTSKTRIPDVKTDNWVYDEAGVFDSETVRDMQEKNKKLVEDYGVHVAVAALPEIKGWDNIIDFCLDLGDQWGLSGYDFLLVLDIGGDDYCLLQGSNLSFYFSDKTAYQYVNEYLEDDFARKEYGTGAKALVDALAGWYRSTEGQTALSGSGSQAESESSYSDSDGYVFGWGR